MMSAASTTPPAIDRIRTDQTDRVVRAVMLSQLLFMAGNSLTVGGFFNYFVVQFHPSAFLMAAAMIAPETSQSFSFLARRVAIRNPNRKRNWIVFLILGRLASMLLPLALLWPASSESAMEPIMLVLICTVFWHLFQGIGYVNYISWLSDLVPEAHWGRLFSRRQMAGLIVSLGIPLTTVWLRQHLLKGLPVIAERWSYSVLFIGGGFLTLTSILPLLCFSDVPPKRSEASERSVAAVPFTISRSFCYLLASRWWLAFFQGLTQAVLFKYAVDTLKISLPTYTVLTSLMILLQLPLAWWAGLWCDAYREKQVVFWSLLAISCALPFWMFAKPESWFLICAAYAIWGGFGIVNVCGQSLCLKLAPASDNTGHFALYDQIAGLIAGLAGLLGGFWLDQLLHGAWPTNVLRVSPFVILFGVSWLGRLTAPLWLLPVQAPTSAEKSHGATTSA